MGNPFVHIDLATDDVAAAKKFYKSVFDWTITDFPAMGWSGIQVGDGGVGGGMGKKNMPNQPTAWTAYVEVDDVKKTIAKAKKGGASIIVPFAEVGDMGSLGVFVDPQGATIGVWHTNKPPAASAASAKKTSAKKAAARPKKAKAGASAKKTAAKPGAKKPKKK